MSSSAAGEALAGRHHVAAEPLLAWFEERARSLGFALDGAQKAVTAEFARIEDLLTSPAGASRRWLRFLNPAPSPVTGLYLWGGVGRGKSFLMDGYFEFSVARPKRRAHFHRFMQEVHHELRRLQGTPDPLQAVAAHMAGQARLLCLDEFQVTDIGDAMILRRLLEGLLARGVALVTTSNIEPGELYLHGLQRGQFLPAIELIRQRLVVHRMDAGIDYRQQVLEQAGLWHQPLDAAADRAMEQAFLHLAGEPGAAQELAIAGRPVWSRRVAGGVAWFDFSALCDGPRAQADYIELARRFHTVLLSGVPQFAANGDADRMRRFTWLVDEFYDRQVKLVVAAQADVPALYARVARAAEHDRTASRLVEMQTRRYLGEAHRP
jgi:cell division protein ZapE